jgi:hypothetical protein
LYFHLEYQFICLCTSTETFTHTNTKVKSKTGELHDVVFNKIAFVDEKGKVTGLLGFIVDISNQKKAETKLVKKNEEYKKLKIDIYN